MKTIQFTLTQNHSNRVKFDQEKDTWGPRNHGNQIKPIGNFNYFNILVTAFVIIASNWFFISFIRSKPDGRKTVLGKLLKVW